MKTNLAVIVVACLSYSTTVVAQIGKQDYGDDHKQWKEYFKQVAASYKMVRDADDQDRPNDSEIAVTPWAVTPDPVHSYYNSGGGEYNHGTFFFWTLNGRPEAIGQLWCYGLLSGGSARVVHEMHSLSTQPFRAALPDKSDFWTPRQGGLEFA